MIIKPFVIAVTLTCQLAAGQYIQNTQGNPAIPPEKANCLLVPESGTCGTFYTMFYYDARYGECREFEYGGCGGNANLFSSRVECLKACSDVRLRRPPTSNFLPFLQPRKNLKCLQLENFSGCYEGNTGVYRYFYDAKQSKCVPKMYCRLNLPESQWAGYASKSLCSQNCPYLQEGAEPWVPPPTLAATPGFALIPREETTKETAWLRYTPFPPFFNPDRTTILDVEFVTRQVTEETPTTTTPAPTAAPAPKPESHPSPYPAPFPERPAPAPEPVPAPAPPVHIPNHLVTPGYAKIEGICVGPVYGNPIKKFTTIQDCALWCNAFQSVCGAISYYQDGRCQLKYHCEGGSVDSTDIATHIASWKRDSLELSQRHVLHLAAEADVVDRKPAISEIDRGLLEFAPNYYKVTTFCEGSSIKHRYAATPAKECVKFCEDHQPVCVAISIYQGGLCEIKSECRHTAIPTDEGHIASFVRQPLRFISGLDSSD